MDELNYRIMGSGKIYSFNELVDYISESVRDRCKKDSIREGKLVERTGVTHQEAVAIFTGCPVLGLSGGVWEKLVNLTDRCSNTIDIEDAGRFYVEADERSQEVRPELNAFSQEDRRSSN